MPPTGATAPAEIAANDTTVAPDSNPLPDSSTDKTTPPISARTSKGGRSRGTRQPSKSAPAATESASNTAQEMSGQRFVLITKSGDIIEREMILVRRITIENNQVIVLLTDGKSIRQPLANVLRMSIEPR